MPTNTAIPHLRETVETVLGDALNFYLLQSEDVMDCDWAMHSAMQVREIEAAQTVLPLLIEEDGETFASPASAAAIRETLVRFFHDLRGRSLRMIQRRVADLLDQIGPVAAAAEERL